MKDHRGTLYEVIIHVLILARTNARLWIGGGGLTQNVSLPPPPNKPSSRKEKRKKKKEKGRKRYVRAVRKVTY